MSIASTKHKAVAEGVETRQQLAFLNKQGCPVAQGYLFGRPIDAGTHNLIGDT
ncbi:MAG: EAL domain-containing protein [Alphaproteobacteria bacterium]|nr:EAL domain-containing protein [Alphaproteobacteria bacterium]